jgi:hypothetical protein
VDVVTSGQHRTEGVQDVSLEEGGEMVFADLLQSPLGWTLTEIHSGHQ